MAASGDAKGMPAGYIPPNVMPHCSWSVDKTPSDSPHHHLPKRWVSQPVFIQYRIS